MVARTGHLRHHLDLRDSRSKILRPLTDPLLLNLPQLLSPPGPVESQVQAGLPGRGHLPQEEGAGTKGCLYARAAHSGLTQPCSGPGALARLCGPGRTRPPLRASDTHTTHTRAAYLERGDETDLDRRWGAARARARYSSLSQSTPYVMTHSADFSGQIDTPTPTPIFSYQSLANPPP